MRKKPWHSKKKGIKVYHNSNKCTTGNNIEKRNHRHGTGGHRLCKECSRKH